MNKEDLADELIIIVEDFTKSQTEEKYFSTAYLAKLDNAMDKLKTAIKDYQNRGF